MTKEAQIGNRRKAAMRLCGHFHSRQSACEVALWQPELGTKEQRKRKIPTGVSGEETDPGLNLEKWV